ncbi:MAG: hypothetical protein QOI78_3280, partial [Actinomycetota bacterium]|nr:hypothetical protein [Actinomycetota bacterium]
MNTQSIQRWLGVLGVPPEVVSLGAEVDN